MNRAQRRAMRKDPGMTRTITASEAKMLPRTMDRTFASNEKLRVKDFNPAIVNDDKRVKLTNEERSCLLRYTVGLGCLYDPRLDNRAKASKAVREMKLARIWAQKFYDKIVEDVPLRQMVEMHNNLLAADCYIGVKGSEHVHDNEYGQYITIAATKTMVDLARDHCLLCTCDRQSAHSCPVRQLLNEINILGKDAAEANITSNGCPYFSL